MALKQLLDTNIILYFLAGKLSSPLPDNEYVISVITQLELLSFPGLEADSESKIEEFLNQVEIVGLTSEIVSETVLVRRKHKLKLPDSIIIATAKVLNVVILTNDQQILKNSHVKSQSLQLVNL